MGRSFTDRSQCKIVIQNKALLSSFQFNNPKTLSEGDRRQEEKSNLFLNL